MKEHISKYSGIYILLALVVGVFIGNSIQVKNFISRIWNYISNNNTTLPASEGTACTTADGKAGTITGGICTAVGDVPTDANIQRTSSSQNSIVDNIASGNLRARVPARSGLPYKIVIPVTSKCQLYTTTNPYHHTDGCSYKFDTYVYQNGVVRYCSLVQISCP